MKYLFIFVIPFIISCEEQAILEENAMTGEGAITESPSFQSRAHIRSYQAKVKEDQYVLDKIYSNVACIETSHPSEDQIRSLQCDNNSVAVCHVPYGNPANAHIILISKNAYKNTSPNVRNNNSQNYLVDCRDVLKDLEDHKRISCSQTCKYQNYQDEDEIDDEVIVEEIIEEEQIEEVVEEEEIEEVIQIVNQEPVDEKTIVEEPVKEETIEEDNSPYNFNSMSSSQLQSVCDNVCGDGYRPDIRNFYQLSSYPFPYNVGLYCGSSERRYQGTPCHDYDYYLGISSGGIASEKTELHRGGWASQRDAAWCIGYHERDYPELGELVNNNRIVPGQIACGQLVDNSSMGF